jgi:nicotinate-nucleotide--dimethylbenzimidazole phosphoribosyltransferase
MSAPDPERVIAEAAASIARPDNASAEGARELQLRLTKPPGSLGRLEELHARIAGMRREPAPLLPGKLIVVAAADHGVAAAGVSAYPPDVTWQMVANFLAGGAAVNVLAAQAGASVRIVDAGVTRETSHPALHVAKVRGGTDDMTRGPAMTRDEAATLVARGIDHARTACRAGTSAIALGDMGIGNTTVAAAVTSAITGEPPRRTAGRGTGIDDATLAAKVAAVERALAVNAPDPADPLDVLSTVGGFELAFLAGIAIGAATCSVPALLDGYPTTAAALVAGALAPHSIEYMLASHVSAEPGHRIALDHLGLRPLIDLQMRLGEGTGAALAFSLIDAALAIPHGMATFASAGVSGPQARAVNAPSRAP